MMHSTRFLPFLCATSAVLSALVGCSRFGAKAPAFKAAKVVRADIVSAIEATGTLEPEDVVDIGAQVTGQILSFGNGVDGKVLDYGSKVAQGQMLAKIDDAPYALAKAQAEAQLNSAQAAVRVAEANVSRDRALVAQNEARVEQAAAQLAQAARDWDRAQKVGTASGAFTQVAFDAAQGAFEAARAALKAAEAACEVSRAQAKASEAAVAQAQSTVAQARVSVALADRNLGYCTIASPIRGIVIDRRVDVGQTVVSNLSASSLFLLAKDLSKMQMWASVNEADIGNIRPDQVVRFTVDAFPGSAFRGVVDKVRLNASMTQNVVTYVVEINIDNADGRLMPYMTANAKFEIARQAQVLAVPSAALRWVPDAAQIAPGAASPPVQGEGKPSGGRKKSSGVVWVKDGPSGEFVKPVKVTPGISDGVLTQITPVEEGAALEGQEVVVGQERAAETAGATAKSPFQSSMPRGRH